MAKKRVSRRSRGKTRAKTGSFQELIAKHSREVQAIARRLRRMVREVLPQAEEKVYLGWRVAFYCQPAAICGIQPFQDHCNFYLRRGAQLSDPSGVLEGTGKGMRHVKVRSLRGIPVGAIKKLIREGRRLAGS